MVNPTDQSLRDQSTLLINRYAINCVAINPADAVYHEVIDRVAIDS